MYLQLNYVEVIEEILKEERVTLKKYNNISCYQNIHKRGLQNKFKVNLYQKIRK